MDGGKLDASNQIFLDQLILRFYHPMLSTDKKTQEDMSAYIWSLSSQKTILNMVADLFLIAEQLRTQVGTNRMPTKQGKTNKSSIF